MVKHPPAVAGDAGDMGLVPGLGRSSGGGNGNPLQYSSLRSPMNRGTWWATVHGVVKSQTRLSDLTHANCCCSAAQSSLTLCNPTDCSTPGFPVLHWLLKFAQTHVHRVGDAILHSFSVTLFVSCSQSFPASGSFPMSGLFATNGQSIGASASASVLPMNI